MTEYIFTLKKTVFMDVFLLYVLNIVDSSKIF